MWGRFEVELACTMHMHAYHDPNFMLEGVRRYARECDRDIDWCLTNIHIYIYIDI